MLTSPNTLIKEAYFIITGIYIFINTNNDFWSRL